MLLVLDVGNTNTVLGVYETTAKTGAAPRLVAHWRVATIKTHTVDEYGVLFRNLFSIGKIEVSDVHGIIVSSVVPSMDSTLREMCELYFHTKPLFVEPGIKTGMPVHYENPQEVWAASSLPESESPRKHCSSTPRVLLWWTFASRQRLLGPTPWPVSSQVCSLAIWDWWTDYWNVCCRNWDRRPAW